MELTVVQFKHQPPLFNKVGSPPASEFPWCKAHRCCSPGTNPSVALGMLNIKVTWSNIMMKSSQNVTYIVLMGSCGSRDKDKSWSIFEMIGIILSMVPKILRVHNNMYILCMTEIRLMSLAVVILEMVVLVAVALVVMVVTTIVVVVVVAVVVAIILLILVIYLLV